MCVKPVVCNSQKVFRIKVSFKIKAKATVFRIEVGFKIKKKANYSVKNKGRF